MKTYTKTIEAPRLEITHDEYASSPREWDNLGYFITKQRNKISPNGAQFPEIDAIVRETGEEAENLEAHKDAIILRIKKEQGEKVLAIYPVYCYEHGNVVYRRGTAQGFDVSNCVFYIVTDRSQDRLGTEARYFENVIDGELETYTAWANGEVYDFVLYDENGEVTDSCGGFYSIEDIREHLPEEWAEEDLTAYQK